MTQHPTPAHGVETTINYALALDQLRARCEEQAAVIAEATSIIRAWESWASEEHHSDSDPDLNCVALRSRYFLFPRPR